MELKGKGLFVWQIQRCEDGDVEQIAMQAQDAGLSHLVIKVADGTFAYNYNHDKKIDYVPRLVQALRNRDISVWGWHYIYGQHPEMEAAQAIKRVNQFSLDGYVINAEAEFKFPGKAGSARIFMGDLRQGLPNTPIALSSYRFPSQHKNFPWPAFLDSVDFVMPQVYWMRAHHNAAAQLTRCVSEYKDLAPHLSIFPTGPAFKEWGWIPYAEELADFMNQAKKLQLNGVNFFAYDQARQPHMQEHWQVIRNFEWSYRLPSKSIVQDLFRAINTRSYDDIIALYQPDAVLVNIHEALQGAEALRKWYKHLAEDMAPNGRFMVTALENQADTISFDWRARLSTPKFSLYGRDTLTLADQKISSHFSLISPEPFDL